jgi:hypothetical protein
MKIPVQYIKEALNYNKRTGVFYWRKDRPREHFGNEAGYKLYMSRFAGKAAGSTNKMGYVTLTFKWGDAVVAIPAHRAVWAISYGEWPCPKMHIDHINWDRSDNRVDNLRLLTPAQNVRHRDPDKILEKRQRLVQMRKGVSWQKSSYRWRAYTYGDSKSRLVIGHYKDYFDAVLAHLTAMKEGADFKKPTLPYCDCWKKMYAKV